MQSTQNLSQLQEYYPLVYERLSENNSSNRRIATVEHLVKELFNNRSLFMAAFAFQPTHPTTDAKNYFSEFTKEVDAYNSKNKTRQYLNGMVAVACVVAIVANTALGVAALGVALIITLNRFPYDQQLNAEKIKTTIWSCENALRIDQEFTQLQSDFTAIHGSFANVQDSFYSKLNELSFGHAYDQGVDAHKPLHFLQGVVIELQKQGKLVNSEQQIHKASLNIITEQFEDYLKAENKAGCLQKAKEYIAKVTQDQVVNNMLPMKTATA